MINNNNYIIVNIFFGAILLISCAIKSGPHDLHIKEPFNVVIHLIKDESHIWASTANGIVQWDLRTVESKKYYPNNRMLNAGVSTISNSGDKYFSYFNCYYSNSCASGVFRFFPCNFYAKSREDFCFMTPVS